jgi:hypothetical protein
MSSDLRERVARGAALLDERAPGWRRRIDWDAVDMSDCRACVLGQAVGLGLLDVSGVTAEYVVERAGGMLGLTGRNSGYLRGMFVLAGDEVLDGDWDEAHGFEIGPYDRYDDLEEAWLEEAERGRSAD